MAMDASRLRKAKERPAPASVIDTPAVVPAPVPALPEPAPAPTPTVQRMTGGLDPLTLSLVQAAPRVPTRPVRVVSPATVATATSPQPTPAPPVRKPAGIKPVLVGIGGLLAAGLLLMVGTQRATRRGHLSTSPVPHMPAVQAPPTPPIHTPPAPSNWARSR